MPQYTVHLVVLKQHGRRTGQGILNAFTAGKLVTQRRHLIDFKQDARIDLTGKILSRPAAGQGKQINIGTQVTGITDLPTTEERLQRHRAAECQADIGIRCVGKREIHQLVDETGHMEQVLGNRTGVGNIRRLIDIH